MGFFKLPEGIRILLEAIAYGLMLWLIIAYSYSPVVDSIYGGF